MWNFQRKPKAFRPNNLFNECAQLREQALAIESSRLSKVETLKTDPLEFFRQVLGVEPSFKPSKTAAKTGQITPTKK
jgi:hypothetical protein